MLAGLPPPEQQEYFCSLAGEILTMKVAHIFPGKYPRYRNEESSSKEQSYELLG